jgi:hypothetical protein
MARWQTQELDQSTGDAVALMTLYIGATEADDTSAAGLLEELIAGPGGPMRTVEGLESLCGALLALLEWETGTPPSTSLQRVGAMAALNAE